MIMIIICENEIMWNNDNNDNEENNNVKIMKMKMIMK